ncbi:MAG: hypothetical protein GY793_03890 [Proteobacteria bacterium]|nr:hypothetical protein [Pseudomonadota bacterium]
MRLVPLFPFVLINIVSATIGVRFRNYFWATLIGIMPVTAIYTYLGHQAGQAEEIKDVFSVKVLVALLLLGVSSIIPVFFRERGK